MKKHKWLDRLGGIDPAYIEEAHPDKAIPPAAVTSKAAGRPVWRRHPSLVAAVAACLCLAILLSAGIWLIPGLMEKPVEGPSDNPIDEQPPAGLSYSFPGAMSKDGYGDIFKLIKEYRVPENAIDDMENTPEYDAPTTEGVHETPPAEAPAETTSDPDDAYREVTDNQVAGVIEADRFKRTGTHIFYLRDDDHTTLEAYSIAKEDSRLVGSYELSEIYRNAEEFYLSADGQTVTLLCSYYHRDRGDDPRGSYTHILSLDVSDPTRIEKKNEVIISGALQTSRLSGGLLLISTHHSSYDALDEHDPKTFVPTVNGECIPAEDICAPEDICSIAYTVLISLRESDLSILDQKAFLSYSSTMYVTKNTVYLSYAFTKEPKTEIIGVYYADDRFGYRGSATVEGSILNQYSMDEYDGILRVVTTTGGYWIPGHRDENGHWVDAYEIPANASLFCIDLETWEIIAARENFAPAGERVYSVRFDREKAYVCTAIQQTDPVFYFDLSDLSSITVKDTGEIDGFSTSLIQLGDGYLLGVGEVGNEFKLEVYKEGTTAVESVAVYKDTKGTFSVMTDDYKSYLIDRERGLFGFAYYTKPDTQSHRTDHYYVLLQFDKKTETFVELVVLPVDSIQNTRSVLIDGYLYIFSGGDHIYETGFYVVKVEKLK